MKKKYYLLLLLLVIIINSCTITIDQESNQNNIDLEIETKYIAPDKVTRGYNNWATCTGEPSLIIRNGPGPNYPRSTVKPSCKFGERAYVQGTVTASNGRLYVKLPGWGTHRRSDGRKYGYADARWMMKGYRCSMGELIKILKKQGVCTSTFRKRTFLFKTSKDANNAQKRLNGFHKLTIDKQKQKKSNVQIAKEIANDPLISYNPFIPLPASVLIGIFGNSLTLGSKYSGNWNISWNGKYYKLYFIYF